jgi:hypothetical protein
MLPLIPPRGGGSFDIGSDCPTFAFSEVFRRLLRVVVFGSRQARCPERAEV